MKDFSDKKIAIVYDWIDKWGGIERTLLSLHSLFPHATFYTSYYDADTAIWAKDLTIKTSFIQRLPNFIKKSRILSLPLYPYAFESFDLSQYDIVISVTSSFAKAVITKPHTLHICYLLTPTRYLWVYPAIYVKGLLGGIKNMFARVLRVWDYIAASRPDHLIAISHAVAVRTQKFYKREARVIYPPFDIPYWESIEKNLAENSSLQERFHNIIQKKFYLVVSRLETYKNVEMVIRTFNIRSQEILVIIGRGTDEEYLKKIAQPNIVFLDHISDSELAYMYQHAEALIMPQEEDFGYVSLEAQFFQCPVIAYAQGGAMETVKDKETGILFDKQNSTSLSQALETFKLISYNVKHSLQIQRIEYLNQFSEIQFKEQFASLVREKMKHIA